MLCSVSEFKFYLLSDLVDALVNINEGLDLEFNSFFGSVRTIDFVEIREQFVIRFHKPLMFNSTSWPEELSVVHQQKFTAFFEFNDLVDIDDVEGLIQPNSVALN